MVVVRSKYFKSWNQSTVSSVRDEEDEDDKNEERGVPGVLTGAAPPLERLRRVCATDEWGAWSLLRLKPPLPSYTSSAAVVLPPVSTLCAVPPLVARARATAAKD